MTGKGPKGGGGHDGSSGGFAPVAPVSRRGVLSLGGSAMAGTGLGQPFGVGSADAAVDGTLRYLTVSQGTNFAASASPDGRTIAMDLYGIIWTLPIDGGVAQALTDPMLEACQPDWSPDGERIAFQAYRGGNYQIWSVRADGSDLKKHTDGPFDAREPRWAADGRTLAFSSDRNGRYGIHLVDISTGAVTPLIDEAGEHYFPSWSPDGETLTFASDTFHIDMRYVDGRSRRLASVQPSPEDWTEYSMHAPVFTPDGGDVMFVAMEKGVAEIRSSSRTIVAGEDVFPFRLSWLPSGDFVYTADGLIKRRSPHGGAATVIPFKATIPVMPSRYARKTGRGEHGAPLPVLGIGSPAVAPDGQTIVFRALNQLYLLPTAGGKAHAITSDAFCKLDPAWSPDGGRLAFVTDRSGTFQLWLRDMSDGKDRQITHIADAVLSPAWSRDGRQIAFLDQRGALHVMTLESGVVRQVHGPLWQPGKPSWSPDGRTILVAAFKPASGRYREGLSEILAIDVASGKGNYAPILPHRSLATRGDDGPVWSPDGRTIAFVFASRLHLASVDGEGRLTEPPRAINDEVTDAPTWTGDSASICYLSKGKLRIIAAAGGVPRTVKHHLRWATARPQARTVVAAGRLWDGTSAALRDRVDVVIDGDRIAAVVPHDPGTGGVNAVRVDARAYTVMPGLVDMHVHRQMQGYAYGDRDGRLWLSMGITSTRGLAGPAYHVVEDQEAIASGARLGPRSFATGEAIDGSRIYYNMMRPVTEPGQMALELERADALSYDLMKAYVRLPADQQREIVNWAHRRGRHVTGHYAYPMVGFGMDGMEHMGATARTGYSRTQSGLGHVYEDVTKLFLTSGASRTPTLFDAKIMLASDRSFLSDERVLALYPPWELKRLRDRTALMASVDPYGLITSLERNVKEILRTIRGGGVIVTGTDAPIDFPAISLHMNLRAMVRFGVTPLEALVTATSAAGTYLNLPLGRIDKGMYADMTMVRGNPLIDITAAADLVSVMKGGVYLSLKDVMGPFASSRAVGPAVAQVAVDSRYWWHDPEYLEMARSMCCQGQHGSHRHGSTA